MALTKAHNRMIDSAEVSVFDYLSDAQRADVLAYTFGVDVTTPCQAALDAAHAADKNCYSSNAQYSNALRAWTVQPRR